MADPSCTTFKPNPWKPNLCCDCAKTKKNHPAMETSNTNDDLTSQSITTTNDQKTQIELTTDNGNSQIALSSSTTLLPCQYGRKCYRTNPHHFERYSHPEGRDEVRNRNSTFECKRKEKRDREKHKELRFIQLVEEHVQELINNLHLKDQEISDLRRSLPARFQYQQILEQSLAEAHDERERREIERKRILLIPRQVPSYWGPNALTELYREIKIPNQSPEFDIINALLNSTITTHGDKYGTIYGKDPTEFVVTQIKRIQNTTLWHEYCYKKDSIIDKNHHKMPDCESSKYLKRRPLLTPLLDTQANEYWLFHGCSHHTVPQLVLSGYDPRISNLKGMFGGGFYLAENSSKSNQYIPCTHCGENAISAQVGCTCRDQDKFIFSMVLYRAVLGDIHVVMKYDKDKYCHGTNAQGKKVHVRRPPFKIEGIELYDSVMGESVMNGGDKLMHREFILYEKGQAYPEYVIDFRRSAANMRPPADTKRLQDKCRNFLINTFRSVPE